MKILLTGFEKFGGLPFNPSQQVVEMIAARGDERLITATLPVDYETAQDCIRQLIHTHQPDAVMMLGVAVGRVAINLERVAINVDDCAQADNNGKMYCGCAIAEDGPVGYFSTLPLAQMQTSVASLSIPIVVSNHAGAYLCNHVFYVARHELEKLGRATPCGFIHLPNVSHEPPGLPLEKIVQAIDACLNTLITMMVAA